MPSRADHPIADADLQAVLGAAFPAGTRAVTRLGKSFGYPSFRVTTADGEFLLKIAPSAAEIARFGTTQDMTAQARAGGVNTPAVITVGAVREHPYLVQQFAPGLDAEDAWPSLSAAARATFWRDFGRAVAAMHSLTGLAFTEGRVPAGREADWGAHIEVRVTRLHKENVRAAVLTRPEIDRASEKIRTWAHETAAHVMPALVHRDLCLRNVLVSEGKLTALLDFEHARFSDRVFDFVALSANVFSVHPEGEALFLDGYREQYPFPPEAFKKRLAVADGLEYFGGLAYWSRTSDRENLAKYLDRVRSWLS